MTDLSSSFKTIVVIMLFYSVSITLIAYALPDQSLDYITYYSQGTLDLNQTAAKVQTSLESQTNLPIIELGAMVFYSGNVLIDLMLNFAFAIPQMLALFIHGFFSFFNIDNQIVNVIQLFASVVTLVWYFISLIELLSSLRSGRII